MPDNNLVQPAQSIAAISTFQEISCWPNAATGSIYFNSPIDITDPLRRFWGGAAPYTPIAQGQGVLSGSDIQLTDVVSFDVRVLVPGVTSAITPNDQFVSLFDLSMLTAYPTTNPNYTTQRVFDTWSSLNDGTPQPLGTNFSGWNTAGEATSLPMGCGTNGPIIQAIQISLRIWDYKTNQTRQVTVVQAM